MQSPRPSPPVSHTENCVWAEAYVPAPIATCLHTVVGKARGTASSSHPDPACTSPGPPCLCLCTCVQLRVHPIPAASLQDRCRSLTAVVCVDSRGRPAAGCTRATGTLWKYAVGAGQPASLLPTPMRAGERQRTSIVSNTVPQSMARPLDMRLLTSARNHYNTVHVPNLYATCMYETMGTVQTCTFHDKIYWHMQ